VNSCGTALLYPGTHLGSLHATGLQAVATGLWFRSIVRLSPDRSIGGRSTRFSRLHSPTNLCSYMKLYPRGLRGRSSARALVRLFGSKPSYDALVRDRCLLDLCRGRDRGDIGSLAGKEN
jgi:hypothetical protein